MTRKMQFTMVVAAMVSVGAQAALRITMDGDTHAARKAQNVHVRSVMTLDQGKCRVDMNTPKMSTIVTPQGDSMTLFHENRVVMRSKVDVKNAKHSEKYRSELEYHKVQSNVAIAGLVCDDFDVLQKGKKVMQLCLADLRANGLMNEVPASAKSTILQTVFKGRVNDMPVGLPARLISFADGKAVFTNLVVKFERLGSVPASTFQVPAGYKPLELKMPNLSSLFKF